MIDALKFVKGGVVKRGPDPSLQYFRINDKTIQGYNGSIALSTPIEFDVNCTPKAEPFINAITKCGEQITMTMTPAGKLAIRSGKFKAFVNCLSHSEALEPIEPDGDYFSINGDELLHAFKTLYPFISGSELHTWATGILFTGQSVYATNNSIIVEHFISTPLPAICNIPRSAIKEIIAINKPPISAQTDGTSITFHYEDLRFIKAQLLSTDWPDLNKVLNAESKKMQPINAGLFDALDSIKSFTDSGDRVFFHSGRISTSILEDDGATYNLDNFNHTGVYKLEHLALLKGKVNNIDFLSYPKPAAFTGYKLRGVMVGMRE